MVEGLSLKILFLNPPFGSRRPEGLDAPMGIMYLGAVLKQAGHACSLVDHVWEKQDDWRKWDAALSERPDAVLVHTQIRFSNETQAAIRKLRSQYPSLPAIAFGPQASTEPSRLLMEMGFDACVIGEPEEVVPEVFYEMTRRNTILARPGIATLENPDSGPAPRVDPEKLPLPDWDLVEYGRYIQTTHSAVYMASRGLNYEDKFNQPPLIYAKKPTRRLSAECVIRELTQLRERFPGNYMLLFHDEIFTEDRDWVVRLCAELKKAEFKVPYWCFTRPDLIDAELCRTLRRSGFVGLSMGMESGSDRVLDILGKGLTVSQIEKGFHAAQKAGLLTTGSVMIGAAGGESGQPDEERCELESTVRMVDRLHPDVLTVTLTTPLPGTPLYEPLKEKVLAKSPEEFNYYHVWPGKYPLHLETLTANDLAKAVARIRGAWKRKLWKTALRILRLALCNGAFRNTLFNQIAKVLKRKVLPA
jgi:anaerobic magnesium-protoporphyrin IX monomethyl ester cyclase